MRPVLRLRAGALTMLLALVLTSIATPVARATINVGGKAVVATTEGDLLSLRAGPATTFPMLMAMPQGLQVDVVGGPETSADGALWYQVRAGVVTGWAVAEYLAGPQGASQPVVAPSSLVVGGTDGSGARLRDAPGIASTILATIADGEVVVVTGATRAADGYDWAPVSYQQLHGWVATTFLLASTQTNPPTPTPPPPTATPTAPARPPNPAPAAPPPPAAPGASALEPGNHASVANTEGLDLRIRAGAGTGNAILDYAPAGAVLLITQSGKADSQGGLWYGVDYDGSKGWVLGLFVTRTDAPTTKRGVTAPPAPPRTQPVSQPPPTTGSPTTPGSAPSPTAPAKASPTPAPALAPPVDRGRAIANTALKYVGVVKYAWGGTTTAGWDCSGMVGYVYSEATGKTLPRTTQEQIAVGKPVGANEIQAGDLVFFANTYGPGITHNGVALGDGRFVHARSENSGTVISSLSDAYWSAHFAGARRP